MSFPLAERTNTKSTFTTTTNGSTTFLPELYSTPPMPTFQKPNMETPTPLKKGKETVENTPTRPYIPRRPVGDLGAQSRAAAPRSRAIYTTTPLIDRVQETPPLPSAWGKDHDRAICILDARNYTLPAIVAKIRRTFPQIRGTLTPAMIDKRLRQLDQDVYINYWSVGLAKSDERDKERSRKIMIDPVGETAKDDSKALLENDDTFKLDKSDMAALRVIANDQWL
ncbi:hypothetical protein HII31_03330 [Pseudocercospora fuligena]|uniref:Uncharacterized protein n=1 Tax=Pseudocercospora fuligena TaxID=685502 RepID=A0A8H6RQE5_9PEZI|nr:hypothetical protein HII31_03330 [Pseudocercospora fuligena]